MAFRGSEGQSNYVTYSRKVSSARLTDTIFKITPNGAGLVTREQVRAGDGQEVLRILPNKRKGVFSIAIFPRIRAEYTVDSSKGSIPHQGGSIENQEFVA